MPLRTQVSASVQPQPSGRMGYGRVGCGRLTSGAPLGAVQLKSNSAWDYKMAVGPADLEMPLWASG